MDNKKEEYFNGNSESVFRFKSFYFVKPVYRRKKINWNKSSLKNKIRYLYVGLIRHLINLVKYQRNQKYNIFKNLEKIKDPQEKLEYLRTVTQIARPGKLYGSGRDIDLKS